MRYLKFIVFASFLCLTPQFVMAQKSVKKVAKTSCKCMEKQNGNAELMQKCLVDALVANMGSLSKDFGLKSIEELGNEEMSMKISEEMFKRCPTQLMIMSGVPHYEQDKNLDCESIKNGKYYYLEANEHDVMDTIFVDIDGEKYMESMEGGKYFSECEVAWNSKCTMELTSVETNHPVKMEFSVPGQKFNYELIQIRKEYVVFGVKVDDFYAYIVYYKM